MGVATRTSGEQRDDECPHDQGVEEQSDGDGGADLGDAEHAAGQQCEHGQAEDDAGDGHYAAGAAEGTDDGGYEARCCFLFDAQRQQQVVVRADNAAATSRVVSRARMPILLAM
jgi:hypothetical protein